VDLEAAIASALEVDSIAMRYKSIAVMRNVKVLYEPKHVRTNASLHSNWLAIFVFDTCLTSIASETRHL
jgi:hypothetical protein